MALLWLVKVAMAIKHAWKIDPSQSKIAFKVGYMQLGVITGEFRLFNGLVESDDAFDAVDVTLMVESGSVTTFDPNRDEGIKASDFFDVEHFPIIYFASTLFRRVSSGGLFELTGLLTIRRATMSVQSMVSLTSFAVVNASNGSPGKTVAEAVFKFSGMVSRRAFGLGSPEAPGDERVADEVEFFGEMGIKREW